MVKNRKPFYKRWWFILIVIIAVFGLAGSIKGRIEKASDQNATYIWPDNVLVGMIPQPDSQYGRISSESEDYFSMELYKMPKENYEKYVEDCKNSGFTVDYMKHEDYYSAENDAGYSLHLSYNEKEKVLSIMLNTPAENFSANQEGENTSFTEQEAGSEIKGSNTEIEENEEYSEENEAATQTSQSQEEGLEDIRPEFKEALDGYETFMDTYCEFMKKYKDSDDALSMVKDYTQILQEEIEWTEKLAKLEDSEMNVAEEKYYAEVTLRVSQKILELEE